MDWVILALSATILWSICAIINKYARVKYFENAIGYVIFLLPVTFFVLPLLFFQPFVLLNYKDAILAILSGLLGITGYYLWLESLNKEEVSKLIILFNVSPLFVLVLSTIFLKEVLSLKQYIAFLLIFIGTMLVSLKRIENKLLFSAGVKLVLFSALFLALQNIVFKYVSHINFTTMMIYREIGIFILTLIVFLFSTKAREATFKVINSINFRKTSLIYSAEVFGMVGVVLFYLAIQNGPVSLVSIIGEFEMVFILIFTILLTKFFPKILKESISKKILALKIISIILMLIGLYLISAN